MQQDPLDFLGMFEGFNYSANAKIDAPVAAKEILAWDIERLGRARFWATSDNETVARLLPYSVDRTDLEKVIELLDGLGEYSGARFLQIVFALRAREMDLHDVTGQMLTDDSAAVFEGHSMVDCRRRAADALLRESWPEIHHAVGRRHPPGISFDPEVFLESGDWLTLELRPSAERWIYMVAPTYR